MVKSCKFINNKIIKYTNNEIGPFKDSNDILDFNDVYKFLYNQKLENNQFFNPNISIILENYKYIELLYKNNKCFFIVKELNKKLRVRSIYYFFHNIIKTVPIIYDKSQLYSKLEIKKLFPNLKYFSPKFIEFEKYFNGNSVRVDFYICKNNIGEIGEFLENKTHNSKHDNDYQEERVNKLSKDTKCNNFISFFREKNYFINNKFNFDLLLKNFDEIINRFINKIIDFEKIVACMINNKLFGNLDAFELCLQIYKSFKNENKPIVDINKYFQVLELNNNYINSTINFLEEKKKKLYNINNDNILIIDDDYDNYSDDDNTDSDDDIEFDNNFNTNIEPYIKKNKLTFNGLMKINNYITTENNFSPKEERSIESLSTTILKEAIIGIENLVLEQRKTSGFPWKHY